MDNPKTNTTPETTVGLPPSPEAPQPAPEAITDAFKSVCDRANAGDERSRKVLLLYLDRHPQLWSHFGDMARHTESSLVDRICPEWFGGTAIRHEAATMRRELAGPQPTRLEQLAVARVVLCWLQLNHAEIQFQQSPQDHGWAKYSLRRLEIANKMYESALDFLVRVQGLVSKDENLRKPATDSPEPAHAPESTPLEEAAGNLAPMNRLRRLEDLPACLQHLTDDRTAGVPRMNGHRHRLEEVLAKSDT